MGRKVTQIVEDQFKSWRHQNRNRIPSKAKSKFHPIITISREFGALGAALAQVLGKKLGFKVWDKELLHAIADELGSDEKLLETVDERRRNPVEDNLLGFMNNLHTNVNYLLSLNRVVKTVDKLGGSIIVGRGACYICKNDSSFHIRVVAPLSKRIAGYAGRENITHEKAREIINQKDTERADFVKYSFNRDVGNPSDYDLVINSDTYTLEEMADIVIRAYEIKVGFSVSVDKGEAEKVKS